MSEWSSRPPTLYEWDVVNTSGPSSVRVGRRNHGRHVRPHHCGPIYETSVLEQVESILIEAAGVSFAIAETAPAGYPQYGDDHRLTSATTTAPKDTLISLGKFASPELDGTQSLADLINEPENTINFMPLAHVLARRVQLNCLVNGLRMAHTSDTH